MRFSGSAATVSYSYTNPATGKATAVPYSVTDVAGNTTSYTYDGGNQLTQATQKNGSGGTIASYLYGYDPVGNMTSQTINGTSTTFSYNTANELTQATGGINKTFTYDGNGNRTASSDGMGLTYNAANQTTSVTPPGGSAVNMAYTDQGQAERVVAGSTSYQYDLAGLGVQTTGSASTYTTALPDGTLISDYVSGHTCYFLTDGQGSVVELTDQVGLVKDQYSYDPTGNLVAVQELMPNPYRYRGMLYDTSTGLYYGHGGFYDPTTGQTTGCRDHGWTDSSSSEDRCGQDERAYDDGTYAAPPYYYVNSASHEPSGTKVVIVVTYLPGRVIRASVTITAPPGQYVWSYPGAVYIGSSTPCSTPTGHIAPVRSPTFVCERPLSAGAPDKIGVDLIVNTCSGYGGRYGNPVDQSLMSCSEDIQFVIKFPY